MISDRQRFPLQGLRSAHHGPAESRERRLLPGRGTVGLGPITMRVRRHPVTCPGFHFTVQLTASNPNRGAFKIVPGSHDSSARRSDVEAGRYPVATADTQPSDVTLHVTHEMHAAPPPRGRAAGRRTLHLGFGPRDLDKVIGPVRAFDDLITLTSTDGHVGFGAEAATTA